MEINSESVDILMFFHEWMTLLDCHLSVLLQSPSSTDLMQFHTAPYKKERSLNQCVYETKNESIKAALHMSQPTT